MGAVASSVAKSVLGHTDAENAFRPWWDSVQDHLIYGLITTGKLGVFRNIYSRVQNSTQNWSVWCKMALGEVGV